MKTGEFANEHGTQTSRHICDTCGVEFTITPAADKGFENCLAESCPSYDPHRDIEPLFMSDAEIAREKDVVSIDVLRQRRRL